MVRIHNRKAVWSAALGAFGAAAFLSAAPSASAEPAPAPPPPAPAPLVPAAAPAPAPLPPVAAAPLAAPAPVAGEPLPAAAIPHLSSPENLPPGASLTPTGPSQGRGMSYLRELWHAVQTQEVSKADAVLLLTQRPLDASAPAGVPAGPQAPLPPAPLPPAPLPVEPAPAAAPAPAPAPLPPVQ